jgi:hypothetical protein
LRVILAGVPVYGDPRNEPYRLRENVNAEEEVAVNVSIEGDGLRGGVFALISIGSAMLCA